MTKEVLETACMAALMPQGTTCLKALHNKDTGELRSHPSATVVLHFAWPTAQPSKLPSRSSTASRHWRDMRDPAACVVIVLAIGRDRAHL